jgi:peptidyl-prolyl cis-trans isomerase A (cyclophilin A)
VTIRRRHVLGGSAAWLAVTQAEAAVPEGRTVIMRLENGVIRIVLSERRAPLSCADFLRYVASRDYDGGAIIRVVRPDNDHGTPRIDVVQGGIRPGVTAGPPIAHENTEMTGLRHLDGTISLPRDKVGTGSGAAFFICIGDQPALDFGGGRNPDRQGFAAFGRVLSGMDTVRAVWRMDASAPSADAYTAGQMLRHKVGILSARVESA